MSAKGSVAIGAISIAILYIWLRVDSADPAEVVTAPVFENWPGTPQDVDGPQPSTEIGPVDIQTWLDKDALSADNGESAELRITITNRSNIPVESIAWITFSMPGLAQVAEADSATGSPGCWSDGRPACVSGDTPSGLPVDLAANSSLTVRALVGAGPTPGQFAAGGLIGWKHGAVNEVRAFQAGPVRVWKDPNMRAKAIVSALETLAIPALLAALAWWFQNLQHARDLAGEVWKAELPRIHEYSEKYYLPMVRNLRRFLPAWSGWRAAAQAPGFDRAASMKAAYFREAVYQYLMFRRRMQRLQGDKSSLFFKNDHAETLAAILITRFLKVATAEQDLESKTEGLIERINRGPSPQPKSSGSGLDRPLSLFSERKPAEVAGGWGNPYEDPPRTWFWDRMDSEWREAYEVFAEHFADWLETWACNPRKPPQTDDYGECVWALRAVREILLFEANRPFQKVWYGTDRMPNIKLLSNSWLRLNSWIDTADQEAFKAKCVKYLNKPKPEQWAWEGDDTAQPL